MRRVVDELICCGRCGRKLRSAQAIESGFGRACYERNRLERIKAEYERNQQELEFEWDRVVTVRATSHEGEQICQGSEI